MSRQTFILIPRRGNVVDYYIVGHHDQICPASLLLGVIAGSYSRKPFSNSDVAYNSVMCARTNYHHLENLARPLQGNASARRSLPGDGDEWIQYTEFAVQQDLAAHGKDTGPEPGRFDARAQAAGAGIIKVGDFDNHAAATANGNRPAALGAGKGGNRRVRRRERTKRRAGAGGP
ncbi:MAG: hypothetical protein ACREH8_22570 [Opitutaceae bacterium]